MDFFRRMKDDNDRFNRAYDQGRRDGAGEQRKVTEYWMRRALRREGAVAERDRLRREIADALVRDLDEDHPAYVRLYAALDEPPERERGAVSRPPLPKIKYSYPGEHGLVVEFEVTGPNPECNCRTWSECPGSTGEDFQGPCPGPPPPEYEGIG